MVTVKITDKKYENKTIIKTVKIELTDRKKTIAIPKKKAQLIKSYTTFQNQNQQGLYANKIDPNLIYGYVNKKYKQPEKSKHLTISKIEIRLKTFVYNNHSVYKILKMILWKHNIKFQTNC